jgi:hypothetical protein
VPYAKEADIRLSQDGSVGVAKGYGLDGRSSIPGRDKIFLLIASRPTLGPSQPPIQCVPGETSQEVKRPGSKADHSPQSNADAKNGGAIPPLPHMFSWHSKFAFFYCAYVLWFHHKNIIYKTKHGK